MAELSRIPLKTWREFKRKLEKARPFMDCGCLLLQGSFLTTEVVVRCVGPSPLDPAPSHRRRVFVSPQILTVSFPCCVPVSVSWQLLPAGRGIFEHTPPPRGPRGGLLE